MGKREIQVESTAGLSQRVRDVFESVASCGVRYESTGASKILHTMIPRLFVMWDATICAGYAVSGTSYEYAHRFLPRVQKQLDEAIQTYMSDHARSRENAAKDLSKRAGGRFLTRLLDEYNYGKFTMALDELWS